MAMRLGTRGSELALAQARSVAEALGGAEIVPIRTSGDEGDATPGADRDPGEAPALADKSRFVREIERALLDGEVDVAVHSAKDLPAELPDGLTIAGVPRREDRADAFVGDATSLDALAEGARIGTSSLRRRAQLLALRPDLEIVEMRGNVDTRLRRLADGGLDGIVLAAAGLRRLGRESTISFRFSSEEMTSAAGQGALALQARFGDSAAAEALEAIADPVAVIELGAERALVAELGASCNTPIGASASVEGGRASIAAFVGLPDGSEWVRDSLEGAAVDAVALGHEIGERLRRAGAGELLARAERAAVA